MTIKHELEQFYNRVGFGQTLGKRPLTVSVYTGCLLVPLPNIEARHKYLKYHDIHHLVNDYSVGRIGEGEVSAWELGTGSFLNSPLLGIMNLIALSTGLVLQPKRMWLAYVRGCLSKNLYSAKIRKAVDAEQWLSIDEIKNDIVEIKGTKLPTMLRTLEFATYCVAAMLIHAAIAIPALILRIGTDIVLKKDIIKAFKPVIRTDLY